MKASCRGSPREWTCTWHASQSRRWRHGDFRHARGRLPDRPAALIDFVTPNAATEYRVGYGNFFVITRYNRSSFYAAAVMDLAAELHRSK
jgi:membrane-bound lytic murein transglycosylase B